MSTRPHVVFRKYPWQRFLRCTTPGCGFIARDKNAHIAHANGIRKDHEEEL